MTIALIATSLLVLQAAITAAFLLAAKRHDTRIDRLISLHSTERAQTTPDLAALISLVENLCQRIQAPEQAIVEHSLRDPLPPLPRPAPPDDDEAWWAAQDHMSKEDLAETLMAVEVPGG